MNNFKYFLKISIADYIYKTGKIYTFIIHNNEITFLNDLKTPQELSIAKTYELQILPHLDNHSLYNYFDYLAPALKNKGFVILENNPRLYPTMEEN